MLNKLGIVTLFFILTLSGCATFEGYPSGSNGSQLTLQHHEPLLYKYLTKYDNPTNDKKRVRNSLIRYRMAEIDHQYLIFEKSIYVGSVRGQAYRDGRSGFVDEVSSLFGGISRLEALKAVSVLVRSADGGKDLIPSAIKLIAKMKTDRKKTRNQLIWKMKRDSEDYGIYAAWSDLNDYYTAGTIPNALAAVTPTLEPKIDRDVTERISSSDPIRGETTREREEEISVNTSSDVDRPSPIDLESLSKSEFEKWAKQPAIRKKLVLWSDEKRIDLYDLMHSDTSKYKKLRSEAYSKYSQESAPVPSSPNDEPLTTISSPDYSGFTIRKWYGASTDNRNRLDAWVIANNISVKDLIDGDDQVELRKKVMEELPIK